MDKKGYELFKRANGDRLFMSKYYHNIIGTKHFKDNLSKEKISKPDKATQEFDFEINKSWDEFLIESGRATQTEKQVATKYSLAAEAFAILSDMENVNFKIINQTKFIGAVREDDKDYQVNVVQHKKPQVDPGQVAVAKNLKDYVQNLAEELENNYAVVLIKNNQITVEDDNGNQSSIKITKKTDRLF